MRDVGACKLCGSVENLRKSHVVPAFAVRWLRETAATSYLRNFTTPNKRLQDVGKTRLLCQSCETLFSKDEGIFAKEIFQPYVTEHLDPQGRGRGQLKEFRYDNWLLHFAISVQWRVIASREKDNDPIFDSFEAIWRQFLLGKRRDTGICETHLIFLQSFADAITPSAPVELGTRVNTYILRSVDSTTVSSKRKQRGVYSKLGPIVFFTSLEPPTLKGNGDSRLHLRGTIKTGQLLRYTSLNEFIFITRPNQLFSREPISDKQHAKISDDMLANPEKALNSPSFHALEADFQMGLMKGT